MNVIVRRERRRRGYRAAVERHLLHIRSGHEALLDLVLGDRRRQQDAAGRGRAGQLGDRDIG